MNKSELLTEYRDLGRSDRGQECTDCYDCTRCHDCTMDFEGIAWLGYKRIELKPSKSVDRIILNWRL